MFVPTRRQSGWRFLLSLALTAVVLLATSCAVSFRGTTQGIPFDSNPQGAEVYLDGELVGVTPVTVELGRGRGHTLLVRLGDQEREVILTNSIDSTGGGTLALDVVPGGILTVAAVADPCASSITCSGTPPYLFCFDRSGMCRELKPIMIGIGAGMAAIPLMIDLATGAVYELSPAEVMIDFEVPDEAPPVEEIEGDAK